MTNTTYFYDAIRDNESVASSSDTIPSHTSSPQVQNLVMPQPNIVKERLDVKVESLSLYAVIGKVCFPCTRPSAKLDADNSTIAAVSGTASIVIEEIQNEMEVKEDGPLLGGRIRSDETTRTKPVRPRNFQKHVQEEQAAGRWASVPHLMGGDDPLPAIENLQISGEAFPGQEVQVCGYSINGTTSVNFEWIRWLEDGSVIYVDGAKQPNYLVTADDIDTYLAVQVVPLDNRKRKGKLVQVFANEQRKITCDPEMQEQIEKILYSGHASYRVSLSSGYLDIWEPAIMAIKREGYTIKSTAPRGFVFTEKFLQNTDVTVPYGHPTAFSVHGSAEHLLRAENSSLRDTIVLAMRLFIMRAAEKSKAREKGNSLTNRWQS